MINRSLSVAIALKTLVDTCSVIPTNYSSKHVFGCLMYMMWNFSERIKLDPNSYYP